MNTIKKIFSTIVRAAKIFLGALCILMGLAAIILTFQEKQPLYLIMFLFFALFAYLLLRKPKKEKKSDKATEIKRVESLPTQSADSSATVTPSASTPSASTPNTVIPNTDITITNTNTASKSGFFSNLFKLKSIVAENEVLRAKVAVMSENQQRYFASGFLTYENSESAIADIQRKQSEEEAKLLALQADINSLAKELESTEAKIKTNNKKLEKIKELYGAATYAIDKYTNTPPDYILIRNRNDIEQSGLFPTVELKIHSMDIRDLRKAFKDNDRRIDEVTEKYRGRYTTKVYQTIYELMVIALRAELQNILYELKYQKLEVGIENVRTMISKYQQLACEGSQLIATTVTKFICEIEYLFINAVKIEYNYYVRKEQARQEQLAIREQMKQEAAERKALEAEKAKVENEEAKYKTQISNVQNLLGQADDVQKAALLKRLAELEAQLSSVVLKKEEITNLQNGKAGNVYIISNLGSFGESMFKVGMTRRLDPQERVDELGSASVPFEFDVHSFIFSEDAVGLEKELHRRLNDKRVNKVNMRKEFFYSTLDELEALTYEISPTASFTRTMAAEEYRQSQSTDKNFEEISPTADSDEE